MTKPADHLVEPPIVDALRYDRDRDAFVVTFVPSDDLSAEPKLIVTIPEQSVEGRQIRTWLDEFGRLMPKQIPVERLVHAGAGDFTFLFKDDTSCKLSDPGFDENATQRIYDGLQYISQAAENAYRIVQLNLSQPA
ncbi:MAG: hypothetical protein V3T70_02150 [Phycisphaerae bacterium]